MDLETRRRIRAYKKALPELRERVVAVALLLAMSVSMLVSASFAWLTLSRNPEVSAISTTVTANGNLEIALAQGNGQTPPAESKVGDSSVNQSVLEANKTWGNLINLNDASYGLDYMELRPAQLNDASLANSPLWGSVYAEDGRIITRDSRYTYTMWNPNGKEFMATKDYGVRAIASYTTGTSGEQTAVYDAIVMQTVNAHNAANNAYKEALRDDKIGSLSSLMGAYLQIKVDEKLNGGEEADIKVEQLDISKMYNLYKGFFDAVKLAAQAKVELANLQQYIYATNHEGATYTPVIWEDLVTNQNLFDPTGSSHKTNPTTAREAISLTGLKQFITDYNTVASDLAAIEDYKNNYSSYGTIYFNSGGKAGKNIGDIVSRLVDPATAHLIKNGEKIVIGNLGASDATKLLGYNGPVVVNNGILIRIEQNIADSSYRVGRGEDGYKGKVTISVKALGMSVTVNGYVTTAADGVSHFSADFSKTTEIDLSGSEKIAEDTYGLAIDFWVRSNAAQTYLTLEGKLDKTTELVQVTGIDGSGNQVPLYTVTITRSGNEFEADVYSKDSKWYYAGTNTEVTAEEMQENTPAAKNLEITTVHGYTGENRVWENAENDALLTAESTTQGNGSCYIYYADTPEDMQHSLDLLNAMKVAFISGSDLLATASMDTAHYYAVNGRVTVPMKLDALSGVNTGTVDEEGNTVYGIAPLAQNEARMITALVYLDGTMLGNDNVLASSAIGGQLNIQFGSSQPLTTVGDENLKDDIRTVTASVSKTEFDYMDYLDGDKLTTYVTVKVDGDNPNQVTAFFQRAINATQGTRQETMTFTKQEDGTWQTSFDFTAPGDYYLRMVRLDGIDYPLAEPCQVTVSGFALQSIDWGESTSQATKYLVESYYDETISVAFASSSSFAQPKTVAARFIEQGGNSVNIDLKFNATTQRWEGTGRFISSGTYQMSFLVLDGEYHDASAFTKTLTLYMGLTTQVENAGSTLQDKYEGGMTYSKNVNVYIYDNAGNILENLMDARLEYSRGGDSTDTVNIPLEWDGSVYRGTMPLTNPGRYTFYAVQTGSGTLTRATESPVYVIASPDVPKYDRTSTSNYNSELQFAPFTYDAYIGPVKISNAASVAAVVYNDAVEKNFLIPQEDMSYSAQMDAWIMNLPTYYLDSDLDDKGVPKPGAAERQAGTWTVKQIMVWDCYDESGTFHDSENPIVWVHGEGYDFSLLSTTVSDSVKVTMNAGITELGDLSTPFMTAHDVADLGMYAELKDDAGNVIPADKVSDITLNLSYTDNTDIANYGYVVSGYSREVQVKLNQQDAAGHWQFSDAGSSLQTMQYVGQYKVQSLVVTMKGGKVLTYYPGTNGIPSTYTVKSAAPTADNLLIKSLKQGSTVFGKNGETVVGQFLESYNPGVEVELALVYMDDQGNTKDAAYARVEGVTVSLKLTYQDGKKAPNGGEYTWSGTSQYETIDVPMNLQTGGYRYRSGTTPMLAGKYSLNGTITVNGSSKSIGILNNISVYSVKPTVKVTGVTPGVTETFNMNKNTATDDTAYLWDSCQSLQVQNYMSDYLANVYIKAEPYLENGEGAETIDYTAPVVELTLSNAGTFQNAQLFVNNASNSQYESVYTFTQGAMKQTSEIGGVVSEEKVTESVDGGCGGEDSQTTIYFEKKYEAGEQTISWIIMSDDNGTAYTVYLNHDLTIRQTNTAPPSISFAEVAGYTTPAGKVSADGGKFVFTLPSNIGTTNATIVEANDGGDWGTPKVDVVTNLCYVENGDVQTNKVETTSGCDTVKTTYYYYNFTYYLYERHQYQYEKTTSTTTYDVVRGVTGWEVGGKTYAPGDTITVDGAVTAKPIIGELSRRTIAEQTATIVHTTQQDKYVGTSSSTGNKEKNKNEADAKKDHAPPTGYSWFNDNNHFDKSLVNTNEVQVGDDYTKTGS